MKFLKNNWFLIAGMAAAIFIMAVANAQAQEPEEKEYYGAFGLFVNQEVTGSVGGWGALGIPVAEKTISFTSFDVNSVKAGETGNVSFLGYQMQYTMRTGVANEIFRIKAVSLWVLGDVGFTAAADNVVGSYAGGGFVNIPFSKRWSAMVILQADKNSITGLDFKPRFGVNVKL